MKKFFTQYKSHILFYISSILTLFFTFYVIFFTGGINWPDEIFQSIEPAHHMVTDKGFLPWEWQEKVRSPLFPFILAFFLKICYLFTDSGLISYYFIKFLLTSSFLTMILILFHCFSKEVSKKYKDIGIVFFLFFIAILPFNHYFGYRTLTESFSTSLCISSVFLLFFHYKKYNFTQIFLLSTLIGISYGIRFQLVFFYAGFFPAFFLKLYQEKLLKKTFYPIFLGGLLGIFLYGLSDFIYYGTFFISTYKYIEFNVIKNISVNWGTSPFYTYFFIFWTFFGLSFSFLLFQNYKKYYPLLLGFWFYFFIHSWVPHKEIRFIYLIFPIAGFFICLGIFKIYEQLPQKLNFSKKLFLFLILFIIVDKNIKSFKKKIPWNFQNKALQIFLQTNQINFQNNILVNFTENSDLTAGYVYLGTKFKGKVYLNEFKKLTQDEISQFLEKNKISHIATQDFKKQEFCQNYQFCKTVLQVNDLIWISK